MPNAVNLSRMQEEITEPSPGQELAGEKEKGAWEESAVPAFGRLVQRPAVTQHWLAQVREWSGVTIPGLTFPSRPGAM